MKKLYSLIVALMMCAMMRGQVLVSEDFETGNTDGQPPVGWICDADGWRCGYLEQERGRIPRSGDWYVYASYSTDVWMYKEINVTAGDYYRVSLWHITNGYNYFTFEVKAGNQATASAMSIQVVPSMTINNEEYEQEAGIFQAPSSGTFYVGFHSTATNMPWYLTLDDIVIEQTNVYNFAVEALTPDTITYFGETAPLRFVVTNIGIETETVNLNTATGSNLQNVFYVDGNQVNTLTIPSASSVEVTAVTTLPMNLQDGEELHSLVEISSTHNSHSETLDFKVTALEPISDYPFEEGFENNVFPPLGWQNIITNGNYSFERVESGTEPVCTPHDGSGAMSRYKSFSSHAGNTAILVTPKMQLSATDNVVTFWMYRNTNINNRYDRINVYFNTLPNTEGATLLGSVHRCCSMEPVVATEDWYEYSYGFDCAAGYGFVIFEAYSDYGWNMYLDDVTINTSSEDNDPPVIVSLKGNREYADTDMNLTLRLRDASGMPATLDATYTINGVDYQLTFVKERGNYDYTAFIGAQANHTEGTLIVNLVDDLGNSAVSEAMSISWHYQRPLLYETFENCDGISIPEEWTQTGNETYWQWWTLGPTYYTDYDGNEFMVQPHSGSKQAVLEWDDYNNDPQDQMLVSPVLSITRPTVLEFWTWVQYGSPYYDRYVVRVMDCANGTWDDKWDASNMPYGQINSYSEPVSVNLDEYIGKNIKIGFRGYNIYNEYLAWDWFLDDIKVIPTDTNYVYVNELPNMRLDVYPNPAKDKIYINADDDIVLLQIMGVKGELLGEVQPKSQFVEFDLNTLPKGLYMLRITTKEGVTTKKIVVGDFSEE